MRFAKIARRALEGGGMEERTAILTSAFLSLSVLISFIPAISFAALIPPLLVVKRRVFYSLAAASPLLIVFFLTTLLLSGLVISDSISDSGLNSTLLPAPLWAALTSIMAVAALISAGTLLFTDNPSRMVAALMFFRIPFQAAFSIALAMRMLQMLMRDLENVSAILKMSETGLGYYKKLLLAITSVSVLRGIAVAETLYSRGFPGNFDYPLKKPEAREVILLLYSFILFLYSLNSFF
jgi:energy-coupling factor transport system permease protein